MNTDRLIAYSQITISVLFIMFTFVVTIIYEMGFAKLTGEQNTSFATSLQWLQSASLVILYFWFQRSRTTGVPDPTNPVPVPNNSPSGEAHVTVDANVPSVLRPGPMPAAAHPAVTGTGAG